MHRTSPLTSLIRVALIGLALMLCATAADAKGHRNHPPATELTDTEEAAARAEIAAAKRDGQRARAKLKALRAQRTANKAALRAAKAQHKANEAAFMVQCIDERTGPDGGVDEEDAQVLCADALAERRASAARCKLVGTKDADGNLDCPR